MTNILLFLIFITLFILVILKLKELNLMEKQVDFILSPYCIIYLFLLVILFLNDLYGSIRYPQFLLFNNYPEYIFISIALFNFIFIRKKLNNILSFTLSFVISGIIMIVLAEIGFINF